jgi:hypothetical protein
MLAPVRPRGRVSGQGPRAKRHRVGGRIVAGNDYLNESCQHLIHRQPGIALDHVQELRDEVRLWRGPSLLDLRTEHSKHVVDHDLESVEPLGLRIEGRERRGDAIGPAFEPREIVRRHAEEPQDDGARKHARDFFVKLELAPLGGLVEQHGDAVTDVRAEVLDQLAVDCLDQELAQVRVLVTIEVRGDLRHEVHGVREPCLELRLRKHAIEHLRKCVVHRGPITAESLHDFPVP